MCISASKSYFSHQLVISSNNRLIGYFLAAYAQEQVTHTHTHTFFCKNSPFGSVLLDVGVPPEQGAPLVLAVGVQAEVLAAAGAQAEVLVAR